MRGAESKPATVELRFVDAVDVGNPVFAKLVDFDAFYRLNVDRLAGCTPALARKRFVALVMLPIRHARGPGSSFVRTNEYVLKESTDESHASVDLDWSGNVGPARKLTFQLEHSHHRGWQITNMRGSFEETLFDVCKSQ
jgi:hypothetical protein